MEEEEIKIEYFESLEEDPLSERYVKLSSEDCFSNDSIQSNYLNENVNLEVSPLNRSLDDTSNQRIDENNDPCVEKEETWYELISNDGKYQCKFCDLSYSTVQTVRQHVKMKHTDLFNNIKRTTAKNIRRPKLKCHICKMRFKNKIDVQEHMQKHGINNIQNSCFMCYATFKTDTEMLTHLSEKHKSENQKNYLCGLCGYGTAKISHFKQHINTHTHSNQQKCSYCDYTTSHPPNLRIHERTHTNNKPYTCSFNGCDYRCAAKSALQSHQLKHDKIKHMLYCDKCTYCTVYKQSLKKHLDSHSRNSVKTRF